MILFKSSGREIVNLITPFADCSSMMLNEMA
jgi:hypothetical protein